MIHWIYKKKKYLFTKILPKKSILATLAPPGLPSFIWNLFFSPDILSRSLGHTHWGVFIIICNNYKKIFCFFSKKFTKWANCPYFRPPWGANLKSSPNLFTVFHYVWCLNIIFIIKCFLGFEIICRETNNPKFEKNSKNQNQNLA